ncbi:HAD family hydrolase [uncultured Maribacter sp.]|nr:HAD family hydrolase [uncultured Maribacter sp.]
MDLSKIKMVVTDMDGTLLNSKHEVSDRFFELHQNLKDKGIQFVAASGRQYNSIIDKLSPIKNDIIVIAENGGFVMQQNKELLSTPLPSSIKNNILNLIDTMKDVHPVLCTKNKAYLLNSSKEFAQKLKEFYSAYEMLEDLKDYKGEVLKVAIYHFESSEHYIYPHVRHLEENIKVKVSGQNWLDLSDFNAHKGHALKKVQELYHILPEETMVFGDYNNDLEMLAMSKYSFAMANAHKNVKETANYRTESNDNFGVERILEKLIRS